LLGHSTRYKSNAARSSRSVARDALLRRHTQHQQEKDKKFKLHFLTGFLALPE
jgi:hypothetical protein